MKRLVIITFIVTYHLGIAEANDTLQINKNSFGIAFGIGFRNSNGAGMTGYYKRYSKEINLGLGITGYNGFKYSVGLKYYIRTSRKFNYFVCSNYIYTIHEDISDEGTPRQYYYRTSNNQYILNEIGFFVFSKSKETQHHFSIGYSYCLNNYIIEPDISNVNNDLLPKIERVTKSGISFSYKFYIGF